MRTILSTKESGLCCAQCGLNGGVLSKCGSERNAQLIPQPDLVGIGAITVTTDEKDPTSCYVGDGICIGQFTSSLTRQLRAAQFEPVGVSHGWHGPGSDALRGAMVESQLVPGALEVALH